MEKPVDLASAKLNDIYGGGNVPRLNGPEKFRRSSKGHMHDTTSGRSIAVTTASPITAYTAMTATSSSSMVVVSLVPPPEVAVAAVCAMVAVVAAAVIGPVHKVPRSPTPLANSAGATTAAARWRNKPP